MVRMPKPPSAPSPSRAAVTLFSRYLLTMSTSMFTFAPNCFFPRVIFSCGQRCAIDCHETLRYKITQKRWSCRCWFRELEFESNRITIWGAFNDGRSSVNV
ncbi:hypothetical protein HHX47_DHR1001078, partial [Lentinula edodes]